MNKHKAKPASDTTYERFMAHWHAERAAGRDPSGLTPLGWFDAGWTQYAKTAEAELPNLTTAYRAILQLRDALMYTREFIEHEIQPSPGGHVYSLLQEANKALAETMPIALVAEKAIPEDEAGSDG